MIIPNTSEQGYNVTITARALRMSLLAVCLIIITGSAFCAASMHAWKEGNLRRVDTLEKEVDGRKSELAALNKQFGSLLVLEDKLRAIAGLKPRETAADQSGVGGQGGPEFSETFAHPDSQTLQICSLSKSKNESMTADELLVAVVAAHESFSEILDTFEEEQERLLSIPSINPVYSPDTWISSGYGYRKDPINGLRRFHDGIDIVAPRKTPIIAPADGVVTFSGWREGLGRTIEIRHAYGYSTRYGHNEKLVVKKGARVERGDTIALLGSSGRSTGPHLHYEIRENGKLTNPYRYVIE